MDLRMTSLYTHHRFLQFHRKKTWWIRRNVQRFWFFKKKRIFPFLDETLLALFQNAYSATQVNSDPQGKGFLCKQKEKKDIYWNKLGDFSFRDLWRNVLYTGHILYYVNFVPTDMKLWTYCDQIMALKWSDYVLTGVTLWPYSDHIMTLHWSDYTTTLQWSDYDLTVIRIWSCGDQSMA